MKVRTLPFGVTFCIASAPSKIFSSLKTFISNSLILLSVDNRLFERASMKT